MSLYSPCLPHTCSLKLECCLGRVLALRSFFEFSPPSPSIFSSQLQQSYRRAFILELMKGFNRKHHKMNEPEAEVRRIFELAWPGSIAGRKLGEITEKKMAGKWDIENGARPGPASRLKKVSPPVDFSPPPYVVDPTSTPDTNLAPRGKAVIFDAKNYEKTQNHAINQLKITSF